MFAEGGTVKNGNLFIVVEKNLSASIVQTESGRILSSTNNLLDILTKGEKLNFTPANVEIKQTADELSITAVDNKGRIKAQFIIDADKNNPDCLLGSVTLTNISKDVIYLKRVSLLNVSLDARNTGADSSYTYWTFQGGTYKSRPDWIFPLTKTFSRENFMGNNDPDYGGGMPVVDFWTKQAGVAFASISDKPELISLPVSVDAGGLVKFSIEDKGAVSLSPGDKYSSVPFVIISHHGDYYNAFQKYSSIIRGKWLKIPERISAALEPEWCAWGYGRNFTPGKIISTLNTARDLNFKWATVDDGWQDADGDWGLDRKKFPDGDKNFSALVDTIHAHNLKARLWWVPYTACDSAYNQKAYPERMNEYAMKVQSRLALEHPDWFILDSNGQRYQVEWWNSYLLCPAVPEVREYYKKFLTKAFEEWGFDGLKIDGQNLNSVPPCYNPAHKHKNPNESAYAVPEFFKTVYTTTYALKKDAVIQNCPCGTNFSVYNIPYTTQFVGSDPSSGFQVRHRAKTFRALVGNQIPFAGDHVELINRMWNPDLQKSLPYKPEDFASTIGLGGVAASKFTLNGVQQDDSTLMLTPEKREIWKHWLDIYYRELLSNGDYKNLYDIAYDKPETHLIQKGKVLYYSFFSDTLFKGKVELRGLGDQQYEIVDYVNGKKISELTKDNPNLAIEFKDYLLLKAVEKRTE
jgi:alpha-galactosidase